MKIGDYYVLTRQLRTNGTMEFVPRAGRATSDRALAMREARGNAQRLKGDGRPFGVEVHEVVGVGEVTEDGEVGGRPQFVTVYVIDDACEKIGRSPAVRSGVAG
jgi:hypothetical protein